MVEKKHYNKGIPIAVTFPVPKELMEQRKLNEEQEELNKKQRKLNEEQEELIKELKKVIKDKKKGK